MSDYPISWRARREAAKVHVDRILADYAAGRISCYQPGWRWYPTWVRVTRRSPPFSNMKVSHP